LSGLPTHYAAEYTPLYGDPVPTEMFPVVLKKNMLMTEVLLPHHFYQTVHHKNGNNEIFSLWKDNPETTVTFSAMCMGLSTS
jgi:hypothetical protein